MDVSVCLHFSVTDGLIYGYWFRQWGAFRVCPCYKHIPPCTSHTTPISPLFLQSHHPTVSSWKLTKRLRKLKMSFIQAKPQHLWGILMRMSDRVPCSRSWEWWRTGQPLRGLVLLTSSSYLPLMQQLITDLSLSRSSKTQFLNCTW